MLKRTIFASALVLFAFLAFSSSTYSQDVTPESKESGNIPDTRTKPVVSGYDTEGYDSKGYDINGYNRDGYDVNGYDKFGYDSRGYDANGDYEGDTENLRNKIHRQNNKGNNTTIDSGDDQVK